MVRGNHQNSDRLVLDQFGYSVEYPIDLVPVVSCPERIRLRVATVTPLDIFILPFEVRYWVCPVTVLRLLSTR